MEATKKGNWQNCEINYLLDLISDRPAATAKSTEHTSNVAKRQAWEEFCILFQAEFGNRWGPSQIRDQWKRQRGAAKKEYREHVHQGAKPNKRPMEAAKRGRKKGVPRTHASGGHAK